MNLSVNQLWTRLLEEARLVLPDATVRTWLEPAEPLALNEGRLVVSTPDQFAVEWNETKHADMLSRLATDVLGSRVEVVFKVQRDRAERPQMDFFVASPAEAITPQPEHRSTRPLNERTDQVCLRLSALH